MSETIDRNESQLRQGQEAGERSGTRERVSAALENFGEDIVSINAEESGPSIFILGGVHGNEATGILVAEALRVAFETGQRQLKAGSVRLALGNTNAIKENTRWIDERDLNRYFSSSLLEGTDDTWEAQRARRLSGVIQSSDITIDIHATNRPSAPFISAKADAEHERIYRWFSKEAVLEDPCFVLGGEPVTTDEYADQVGNIGICLESGQANDVSKVASVLESVYALLSDLKMIEDTVQSVPSSAPVFTMTKAIVLDDRGFTFAPEKVGRSFESFKKGEVIAYQGETPLVAEYDGVFIFPKAPEHHVLGKPVCYLAVSKTQREEKTA